MQFKKKHVMIIPALMFLSIEGIYFITNKTEVLYIGMIVLLSSAGIVEIIKRIKTSKPKID